MTQEKIPNFFIIGAPKSGTTALSEYLREHPNVFISHPKEPHYFASDMIDHRSIENIEDYLVLFNHAQEQHMAIGEASVWYLYSKKAIQNLAIFAPKAKIIVMLRKPVDMVYSMHSQHLHSLGEDIESFEKAWDLEDLRKQGKCLPKNILHVPNLYYSEIAKYHNQLQNLYKYFAQDQVKVILFDDFTSDTRKVFHEVIDFLNLPEFKKVEFSKVNQNTVLRSRFLEKFLKYKPLLEFRKRTKSILGIKSFRVRKTILAYNSIEKKRYPINPHVKKRVIENYREEVNLLGKLLNKNLDHWNT